MLRLSKHFRKNWQRRVDNQEPKPVEVDRIIRQAIRVQKGKQAKTWNSILKTLSIYWHADRNIIITVDHFKNTVVSVYSKANMPFNSQLGNF